MRAGSAELKRGFNRPHDVIFQGLFADIGPGRAGNDMQRHEMFLPGVGVPLAGGVRPCREHPVARLGIGVAFRIAQPAVKIPVDDGSRAAIPHGPHQNAHIVIAVAAAGNQHALAAQGLQGFPHGEMGGRVKIGTQGKLHDWNIGIGKRNLQRNENAMVIAACLVRPTRNVRRLQQLNNPRCQGGIAGGGVG